MNELKTGPWKLEDLKKVEKINKTVFSCFSCGGGSTMGYKLAGYDVIGCCEIDPQMMEVYKENHNPKHAYLMSIREFKNIPNSKLPKELFELDILDGSPPCSSFSMSGSREKKWGKNKKFREGQSEQILDDLFFEFIDVAEKLKPKVVVAENVKGLIQGNAKGYVKQIFQGFKKIGYECQLFLLNAAVMGVPQKRERVFFIANSIENKIKLEFNEEQISVKKALLNTDNKDVKYLSENMKKYWDKCQYGEAFSKYHPKRFLFNWVKIHKNKPCNTLASTNLSQGCITHFDEPRGLSTSESVRIQTFPEDYNFLNYNSKYIIGMSVPPFMVQRIANQIAIQFFQIE